MRSQDISPPNERILNELEILRHVSSLKQRLIESLLDSKTTNSLQGLLQELLELLQAQAAYIVLAHNSNVLVCTCYSQDKAIHFKKLSTIDISVIPKQSVYHRAPGISLYGEHPVQNSFILPIVHESRSVGVIEFLNCPVDIPHTQLRMVASIHNYLVSSYYTVLSSSVEKSIQLDTFMQTNKMYETVMNNSNDIIVSLSLDGRITSINHAGSKLLGLESSGSLCLLPLHSPTWSFLAKQFEKKRKLIDFEIILEDKEMNPVFALASFVVEIDQTNSITSIYGVFKNITDRIKDQKELWETNAELAHANDQLKKNQQQMVQQEKLASIGQLAAGVAHEINNPLSFIHSNHQMLKEYQPCLVSYIDLLESKISESRDSLPNGYKVDKILKNLPEILQESDEGFNRIMSIVQSMKDFSHIDSQGALVIANVNRLLETTLVVAKNSWKYVATIRSEYGLLPEVECYPDQLNQVFLNIIVNAAQAIESMDVKSEGVISIKSWANTNQVFIEFEDSGPGIPEEIRYRIFEPFYTSKPIGKGTGLGLSVTYDIIVEKHHGTIDVGTSPLGGARFLITLPLIQNSGLMEIDNDLE